MKEIRILLTESTFTQLCKMGFIPYKTSMFSNTDIYITKSDLIEVATGKILTKEVDGTTFLLALQDIGIENIREIVRRSPVYSEIAQSINIDRQ